MNAATASLHCPPKTKSNKRSATRCKPWGPSNQARHSAPLSWSAQRNAVADIPAASKANPLRAQRQIRTVNGRALPGALSANSSLRSTQNHTETAISTGAMKAITYPIGRRSVSSNTLMGKRLATFQYRPSNRTMAGSRRTPAQISRTSGTPRAKVAPKR